MDFLYVSFRKNQRKGLKGGGAEIEKSFNCFQTNVKHQNCGKNWPHEAYQKPQSYDFCFDKKILQFWDKMSINIWINNLTNFLTLLFTNKLFYIFLMHLLHQTYAIWEIFHFYAIWELSH